ncbi:acetyltransferase-like isoleucine patch superfamily enzyme [Aeromonas hydrophila]|uniref:DapH/DapD/GlmU-related protein n=1 Tax=Aeromonas hydrophila TaxID=644 RepID=UPI0021698580|nr:DapH/DapD/GlmU-related protein [Aeromonas hydrophila]MCS3767084.1 acetyltransferase-like isoleucine patch superfamily enzyme [Aeromonas hydrophila]
MMFYMEHYGFWGCIRLIIEVIFTKIRFRNAKIIRTPFECRGKKFLKIGRGFTTGRYCRLEAHGPEGKNIIIGERCQINDSVHIAAADSIVIGDDVLIASRVFITDLNHGNYSGEEHSHPDSISRERTLHTKPVVIGSNVWLGEGVVVLPGVTIGKSSIIGANSVVSRDIPANSIAVGNPARVIKQFDFQRGQWVAVDAK